MGVPRNPYPFGNEYHFIFCYANIIIIYQIELVEGKDEPQENSDPEFVEKKNTNNWSSLLTLQTNIWLQVDCCIRFQLLCAPSAAQMKEYGVYATAIIKKRRYYVELFNKQNERKFIFIFICLGMIDTIIHIKHGGTFGKEEEDQ